MGDVIKPVDRGLSAALRYQLFDSSDTTTVGSGVAAGDVLRVADSLFKAAGRIVVETSAGCDLGVTVNSRRKMYPRADSLPNVQFMGGIEGSIRVLANVTEVETDNPEITVGAGAVWEFEGNIVDVEITTWTAGTWEIRAY